MADLAHDDDAQSKDECAPSIENSNSAQQAISIVPIPEDICLEVEDVEQLGKEGADSMAHTTESPTSPSLTDNKLDIRNGMRTPHKTYTMQYKLSVLDWYYANGENKKRTSKHFGVDRKRIRDWLRLEQKFRMEPHSNMQCTRIARGCPPQYQELDTTVLEWYKEQRAQGQKVTNRALRTKALELAPQFGFQDTFKASSNWAIAWRRRNRDTLGESSASVEDHTLSASATDFDEDLHGLNSESGFATVAEAINGVSSDGDEQSSQTTQALLDTLKEQVSTSQGSAHQQKPREHEHWMALIQQTVDSLENEFNTKMGQIRLLLQHLKGSIQPSTDTCTDIQSSSTRPQHFPSETVRHTGKRSNASGTSTPISTKRARKT